MLSRRASSEFPNDNPELHDGLVWACPAPVGRALPTLRLRAPEGEMPRVLSPSWVRDDAGPELGAEAGSESEVRPELGSGAEGEGGTELVLGPELEAEVALKAEVQGGLHAEVHDAEPSEPFALFVAALGRVMLARGATRAAAAVTALCEHGRIAAGALEDGALRTMVARRMLAPSGTHATAELVATLDAWRGVLNGTANDLSACGAATLDSWAAELVAAALDMPSGAVSEVRRDLRRAGVAAFGLLAVAS